MTRKHVSELDAKDAFCGFLQKAFNSGKPWMAVVVQAEPDGKGVVLRRTTWDFPKDRFAAAVDQFRADLEVEGEGEEPPPLPAADFMWGVAEEADEAKRARQGGLEVLKIPERAFKPGSPVSRTDGEPPKAQGGVESPSDPAEEVGDD